MNYTKGEWKAKQLGKLAVIQVRTDDCPDIAECFGSNRKANAQLIASAPDLYEALKDALNTLEAMDNLYSTPNTQHIIKEALAKAEEK